MTTKPNLNALTSGELAATQAQTAGMTLIIPLGATEQHGPHLPTGTDTFIATAWADRVAAVLDDAIVAPPMAYGSSGEHQSFPGTLSIGQEVLRILIVELVRSAGHDFARVVLLCGHGGNLGPVTKAVTQLRSEGHHVLCFFPTWDPLPERGVDAHAGHTETSLLLHLDEDMVRTDSIQVGQTAPIAELLPTMISEGVAAVSENGVLGDPTEANAHHGRLLLDQLVQQTLSCLVTPPSEPSRVD